MTDTHDARARRIEKQADEVPAREYNINEAIDRVNKCLISAHDELEQIRQRLSLIQRAIGQL